MKLNYTKLKKQLKKQNCTIKQFAYCMQCTPALLRKYSQPGMSYPNLPGDLIARLTEACVYLHECQDIEINPVDILIGDID